MENFNITEWVDEFFSVDKATEDKEINEIFFALKIAEASCKPLTAEIESSVYYQIAEKRAKSIGLHCSPYFLMGVICFCDNPAHIVMFITAYRHLQDAEEINGVKPLYTVETLLNTHSYSVPEYSKEFLSELWKKQKNNDQTVPVDNWLDVIASEEMFINATRNGFVATSCKQ